MGVLKEILNTIKNITVVDVLDICIVWLIFYFAYKFIRERRASKLAVGVLILLALQLVGSFYHLMALRFILQNVFQVGLIALIVVFQPELRSALEKVGGEPLRSFRNLTDSKENAACVAAVDQICTAVCSMALEHTGALIVIERGTKLGEFIRSGTEINADISSFLLKNIFFDKAPMHDGAVVIRNFRILAAGCFLPLSTNTDIVKDLGTRHRAAIGMSENSDAAVVVVSEETGVISLAYNGHLTRNYDYIRLRKELLELMMPRGTKKRSFFKRMLPPRQGSAPKDENKDTAGNTENK